MESSDKYHTWTNIITDKFMSGEIRLAESCGVYLNRDGTEIIGFDTRGGGVPRHSFINVHVDERTGYRYINYSGRKWSLRRLLMEAWGKDYEMVDIGRPALRDEWNVYQVEYKARKKEN